MGAKSLQPLKAYECEVMVVIIVVSDGCGLFTIFSRNESQDMLYPRGGGKVRPSDF